MITPLHGHGASFLILVSQVFDFAGHSKDNVLHLFNDFQVHLKSRGDLVSDTNELVPSDVYRSFGHLGLCQTIIFLMHKELCAQKALGHQRLTHGHLAFVKGSLNAGDAHNF